MNAKQFADAEKLLAGNMSRTDDDAAIALYHSVLGVLFKMQGFYGRKGKELLDRGLIKIPDGMEVVDCYGNEVIPNPKSYEAY